MTDEELGQAICAKTPRGNVVVFSEIGARARALLSPPASNAPISRMSEAEILERISGCDSAHGRMEILKAVAFIVHRLAQPVPEVDPDAEAKRVHTIMLKAYPNIANEKFELTSPDWKAACRAVAAMAKTDAHD